MTNPAECLAAVWRRLESWRNAPQKALQHAAKRILAYMLMINAGATEDELTAYWVRAGWVQEFVRAAGLATPDEFGTQLVAQMRSTGAVQQQQRLHSTTPHQLVAPPSLAVERLLPAQWPNS